MSGAVPDGIVPIELPLDGRRTVNAILVEGRPLTLVDTGLGRAESLAALEGGLAARGLGLADIEQLVITHAHLDHFGAAAAIVRASGARVLADAGGVAEMADYPRGFWATQEYRLGLFRATGAPAATLDGIAAWGRRAVAEAEPITADVALAEGDVVAMGGGAWRVLSVPGHAASSIALFNQEAGLLLSGDILVSIGAANVTLHRVGDGRLPAGWQTTIVASLERLAALPLRLVYPGHGAVIDRPLHLIADRLRRVESRLRQVREHLADGPRTAHEVALALYPTLMGEGWAGLAQAMGYLDALEVHGLAVAEERDGLRRYRQAGLTP